jgi:hypothetical protein
MAQINKANEYFNTVTHTGDGTSPRTITGVNFQPDFTWIKRRDNSGANHILYDSVRGAGSTKELSSNNTASEGSTAANAYGYLSAFASDGFTVTDGTSGAGNADLLTNASGKAYASWNWLANGAGVSNTDGTISSTVSANTTSGFSIVSYTGTGTNPSTVGHGLGTAPSCIILRDRNNVSDWYVGHDGIGWTDRLKLNTTASTASSVTLWNNTAPTSSVFTISSGLNFNGSPTIAYCFAEKKGFSKFGSYTGNGSADGTFVYTGFKPAFVLVKNTQNSDALWYLFDNKRNSFNLVNTALYPNSSVVEGISGSSIMDFVSNGFKLRGSSGGTNPSGQTMIYMAFAEQPLVGDNPATAR